MKKSRQDRILSLKPAGNILVIHTLSGMANGVAMAIDRSHFPEIVGSLAGDDTLFCAMESPESAEAALHDKRNPQEGGRACLSN